MSSIQSIQETPELWRSRFKIVYFVHFLLRFCLTYQDNSKYMHENRPRYYSSIQTFFFSVRNQLLWRYSGDFSDLAVLDRKIGWESCFWKWRQSTSILLKFMLSKAATEVLLFFFVIKKRYFWPDIDLYVIGNFWHLLRPEMVSIKIVHLVFLQSY